MKAAGEGEEAREGGGGTRGLRGLERLGALRGLRGLGGREGVEGVLGLGAEGGIASGDVKGEVEVSLDMRWERRAAVEQLLRLGYEVLRALPVEAKGGADKHKSQELSRHRRISDGDIAVEEQPVEHIEVGLSRLIGLLMVEPPAEDVDEGVLRGPEELPPDDVAGVFLHLDGGKLKIRKFQLTGTLEHLDAQCQADAIGHVLDGDDTRHLSVERPLGRDTDVHVGRKLRDGQTDGEAQAPLAKDPDERVHLLIADDHLPSMDVAEEAEAVGQIPVPVLSEE